MNGKIGFPGIACALRIALRVCSNNISFIVVRHLLTCVFSSRFGLLSISLLVQPNVGSLRIFADGGQAVDFMEGRVAALSVGLFPTERAVLSARRSLGCLCLAIVVVRLWLLGGRARS